MRFPLRGDDISGSIPPRIKIRGILETVMEKGSGTHRVVFKHARETPYPYGAYLWQQRNIQLNALGADSSHQVVVIPTGNLTENISRSNKPPFSDKNPVAIAKVNNFPDNEDLIEIENEVPGVKHITIIGSATNYCDLFHILQVASHYKETLGTKHVTLFAPFLMTTRQDKNCDSKGRYRPVSINVHTTIAALSTSVDTFIVNEPHSFATQTAAADQGKALLPITPWKYLMNNVFDKGICIDGKKFTFTRDNTLIVRPDKGRKIAASRIAKFYGLDHVSFNKIRTSPIKTTFFLSSLDKKKVRGKLCIVYDDELSTCSTVSKIAEHLQKCKALGLIIVGVHGKFTDEWENNITKQIIKKIFVSDSRREVGNIKPYIESGKIEILSLEGLIAQILQADLKRTNFWLDDEYKHLVLQTNGQDESH